ncbi:unnamed protein product [Adineta steineri]|uniref:Wax synthase domain-containing protein n=1 Tax=Adineta steineri TaxID=433720 RepID=A0A814VYR0_9BILA|nr:unnamed protein product [Adineta steineri]
MLLSIFVFIGWIIQILICFYFVRFISNIIIRCILTLVPCIILTYVVAYDHPPLQMTSMLFVTYCWLASIRLIHLIVLTPDQCPTLSDYILKFLWMFFPIVRCPPDQHQKWPILYDLVCAGIKIIVNHWIYKWLLICEGSDSCFRRIMFYILILTYSFLLDIQCAILRTITHDKYMLKPMNNFPIMSRSLHEFWGRRYNQLVGTIFRESLFQPIRQHLSSTKIASLLVFFTSGLLHMHLAIVALKDYQTIIPALVFFVLHGMACTIEAHVPFQLPVLLSWLLTQLFLLVTASLQIGPFIRIGPKFYSLNPPPLFEQQWIPKLRVPNFCPK